eukprot:GDKK01037515.1.p1 GENE.GDKK01037515.1~~GDKK01037515.1.p1  ORF type:complete len:275 (-),score=20.88 GDKK01037515.1:178-894(-)
MSDSDDDVPPRQGNTGISAFDNPASQRAPWDDEDEDELIPTAAAAAPVPSPTRALDLNTDASPSAFSPSFMEGPSPSSPSPPDKSSENATTIVPVAERAGPTVVAATGAKAPPIVKAKQQVRVAKSVSPKPTQESRRDISPPKPEPKKVQPKKKPPPNQIKRSVSAPAALPKPLPTPKAITSAKGASSSPNQQSPRSGTASPSRYSLYDISTTQSRRHAAWVKQQIEHRKRSDNGTRN